MEEDLQTLRAMRDSNLPKFLRDDILLFRAIIEGLFQGALVPNAVSAKLEAQLSSVAKEMGLQVTQASGLRGVVLRKLWAGPREQSRNVESTGYGGPREK
jgi:hypothetical protein